MRIVVATIISAVLLHSIGSRPATGETQAGPVRRNIDMVFMIDNSASMGAISQTIATDVGALFDVFRDVSPSGRMVDLHLGVVTSDYGAGATGAPGCQPSPGGDSGRFQALGRFAPPGSEPPLGANYIEFLFTGPSGIGNLPAEQTLEQTFAAMAAVGGRGCGFEHQLESVYAALRGGIPENDGFLRHDAMLVVVFVTNEDDCSAPSDTDLFDRSLVAAYGYESSFRCTHFGIVSDGELLPYAASDGPVVNPLPAPNPDGLGPGKLFDVGRYIDFFSLPAGVGGVKRNPHDVLLFGITAPSAPFEVILANPGTPGGTPYVPCGPLDESSNPACVPVLQHSCHSVARPEFFGDPAVRLNSVIASARGGHALFSVCDGEFGSALSEIGSQIAARVLGPRRP